MLYTFEHGFPMLYHYKLIELDAISTGAAKFEKFEKALQDDGILDYVKRNLVVIYYFSDKDFLYQFFS